MTDDVYGALPLRHRGVFFTVATRGNGTELNPEQARLANMSCAN